MLKTVKIHISGNIGVDRISFTGILYSTPFHRTPGEQAVFSNASSHKEND